MAVLTDKQMDKHIKERNFAKVYLIYGEEQMYVKKYTDKLVTAVAGKTPSEFNFHSFGDSINFDELAASVQIVPFMSEFNCVLVSDAAFDEFNANDNARFADIYKAVPDGCVFIVSLPSVKPVKNKTVLPALKKYADKNGIVCEFNTLTQNELVKFIAKWANANGKFISQVNATQLISLCGRDLNMLKNEIDKISAYAKGEEISDEDIEKLATVTLESKIFALSDAVLNGNAQKAFNTLDTLFYQQEKTADMLFILSQAFIDAYRIRVADESGVQKTEVASKFNYKNRAFVLYNARRATKRVSTQALRKSLSLLLQAETEFKSVSVNDRVFFEKLIAQLLLTAERGRVQLLKIKEAIIVEGRYDKIKLKNLVDTTIIETNGFRVFSDKEKQTLIRKIAQTRGILVFTDSDSAGFVIRNFLRGAVDKSKIKHCYIPQINGKEKRKAHGSKEGFLGVEGVSDEVIIDAIRKSGATIIGEESQAQSGEITKSDLYRLGLTGRENSEKLRKALLKNLGIPSYLTTNAMLSAINCLYSLEELKNIVENLEI